MLAAAVRREVVAAYEELAASCGLELERIDLMPLAAVTARRAAQPASALDVILGDVAFAVCLHEQGELRVFHQRWRDPGVRATSIASRAPSTWPPATRAGAVAPRVLVLGEGSAGGGGGLVARGQSAQAGSEMAFLGAAA